MTASMSDGLGSSHVVQLIALNTHPRGSCVCSTPYTSIHDNAEYRVGERLKLEGETESDGV